MPSFKKRSSKIPKGYRLKPSTHKLINTLSEILRADYDAVITKACKKMYKELNINELKHFTKQEAK